MKTRYRVITFLALLALLVLPTSSVYAQGPGPGNGRVIFGSNITIASGETFDGDLVLFGGNVIVEEGGILNGDVVVLGGRVESKGEVDGDVVVVGGQVHLEDKAVVDGDVVLVGGQLEKSDEAKIAGDVINNVAPEIDIPNGKVPPVVPGLPEVAPVPDVPVVPAIPVVPDVPGTVNVNFNPFFEFGRVFASALLMAVLGMLAVLFFQQRLDRVSQAVTVQPLMTTSIGLLTIVALFVTAITIVLLPVAALGLIPLGFAWLFGVIAIGQEVGERFAKAVRQEWAPVLTTGLGTFTLMLVIGSIQALDNLSWVVGCFTWILPVFVGLLGIGAVVITRFGARPVPSPAMNVYVPPAASEEQIPPAS